MENEELKSEPQIQADEISALREQYDSLRQLVIAVLVLVIIVSGTLWIYLMRQVKDTTRALNEVRPQATNMIANYEKAKPVLDNFVKNLQDYGRAHPDFVPILNKYGINSSTPTPAVSNPAAAAPTGKKK